MNMKMSHQNSFWAQSGGLEVYHFIWMAYCKTAVTPLLTHWSYCSFALSHWYGISDQVSTQFSVLCFALVIFMFLVDWYTLFPYINQDCITGTAVTQMDMDEIGLYFTITKHQKYDKACIFLGKHLCKYIELILWLNCGITHKEVVFNDYTKHTFRHMFIYIYNW